jgi:hypothetical protein
MNLSLKCRVYSERAQAHLPCSGTTDDGTESACECACHGKVVVVDVVYPYPPMTEEEIDKAIWPYRAFNPWED